MAESIRVLKAGGKFACLEFSRVDPLLKPFYDFYSFQIIPVMGEIIAGEYNSYRYLVESVRKFPDQVSLISYWKSSLFFIYLFFVCKKLKSTKNVKVDDDVSSIKFFLIFKFYSLRSNLQKC